MIDFWVLGDLIVIKMILMKYQYKISYIVEFPIYLPSSSTDKSAAVTLAYSLCVIFMCTYDVTAHEDTSGSTVECYLHFVNGIPGVVIYYELLL